MKLTDADRATIRAHAVTSNDEFDKVRGAYEAGYRAGIEASAKVCGGKNGGNFGSDDSWPAAAAILAAEIRALVD